LDRGAGRANQVRTEQTASTSNASCWRCLPTLHVAVTDEFHPRDARF